MHHTAYWLINKLSILGLAGIPATWALGMHELAPLRAIPAWPGQLTAVAGALIFVVHYAGLRSRVGNLADPARLERSFGLYPRLRHPMYFGDLLLLAGLFLIYPTGPGLALWLAGSAAAVMLARREDAWLTARFAECSAWRRESRLILPGLY